jgi:dsRNA-specific ribonuclease
LRTTGRGVSRRAAEQAAAGAALERLEQAHDPD